MRKKLVLIQFSRALVPILVMLFHISENMKGYFEYNLLGFSFLPISGGVNYFFALSGFMIYYVYRNNFGQPNQIKSFLLNRFIRIYPLYWILTLVSLPAIFLFPYIGTGDDITFSSIIFSLLLFPNPNGLEPVLDVAWSLVHTVYFYLIFSVLFFSKNQISKWILSIWAVFSLAFVFGIVAVDHFFIYFLFNQYNLIFIAGLLSAYFITNYRFNFKVSVIFVVIGVLGFPLTWLNYIHKFINVDFDISTGLSSVLLIFGLASVDIQKNIKIPKLFNYLGNAAFSIYLCHNLFLNAFSELFSRFSIFEILGGGMTSIILLILIMSVGCLVHSLIEKPLITKMKKIFFNNNNAVNKITSTETPSNASTS